MKLSRKKFLLGSVSTLIGGGLFITFHKSSTPTISLQKLGQEAVFSVPLNEIFPNRAPIHFLGKCALLNTEVKKHIEPWAYDLYEDLWKVGARRSISTIQEKIILDYHEGRTALLEGWTLSRTEITFYALVALADS